METINCKVKGMNCSSCALTISRYLEKKGMEDVVISVATEELQFNAPSGADPGEVLNGINGLGYQVVMPDSTGANTSVFNTLPFKFYCSLVFTAPLLLHMWVNWHWLHNPWIQLALTVPVYIVGMLHFGGSAFRSLRN